jgi:hypothetical protein
LYRAELGFFEPDFGDTTKDLGNSGFIDFGGKPFQAANGNYNDWNCKAGPSRSLLPQQIL